MNAHVSKPLDIAELCDKLIKEMERAESEYIRSGVARMTDKAYYEKGFDIVSARERFFGKREMCERYVIRFLEDPNYEEMIKAIREKDTEQAFHYAHTLKGVCANLSLWADAGCSFRGS